MSVQMFCFTHRLNERRIMENQALNSIQAGLLEKRRNLVDWLTQTPEPTRMIQLGPEKEQSMQAQVKTIDKALAKVEDKSIGKCEVCHEEMEPALLEMDYTSCICLDHFSDEERQKLELELEFVQVIQKALLPQQIPTIPGLDLAIFSRPAQIVSGDYFDFFSFQDGAPGFVIADAMGHGVSASLIMSGLQSALRTLIPESDSSVEVLKRGQPVFPPQYPLHDLRNRHPLPVRPSTTDHIVCQCWPQPTGFLPETRCTNFMAQPDRRCDWVSRKL